MTFYSGQKVVCVDDSPSLRGDLSGLKKEEIYTILKVWKAGSCEAVLIHEVEPGETYCGFFAFRFRPITEKKTDISVFKNLKVPTKAKEDA